MKKLESSFANMIIVLSLIALISAGLLALTFEFTREDIAGHQLARQLAALDAVLPDYDNDLLADQEDLDGRVVFPAYLNGELVAAAVLAGTTQAFSGEMLVMAGFDPQGTLIGTVTVQHSETPGLGSKVNETPFSAQFRQLTLQSGEVLSVRKDGGEIDAVTAATISSRAYCDAVSSAWQTAEAYFGGQR